MRFTSRAVALVQKLAAVLAVAAIIAPPMRAEAPDKRVAQGPWGGKTKGVGRYADVNGIKIFSAPALAATVIPFLDEPIPTGR